MDRKHMAGRLLPMSAGPACRAAQESMQAVSASVWTQSAMHTRKQDQAHDDPRAGGGLGRTRDKIEFSFLMRCASSMMM